MSDEPDGLTLREQIKRLAAWVNVLRGRSVAFASRVSAEQLLVLSLAAILLLFYSGLISFSGFRNFIDTGDEGVIIVDRPQLFTRERLLNDRLLESEWIDDQIKRVDEKLRAGDFGKPDTIRLTELLLKLKIRAASINQNNSNNSRSQDVAGALPQNSVDDASRDKPLQDAYQLLEEANGLSAPPMEAFEAASDFREYLSQQRYATILDDAHDLGENTLHRLNLNLTIVPERSYTDSLAAISVRMRETLDNSRVLEIYSRLIVELRKRMQELVQLVYQDKSLIFNSDDVYQLEPSEATIFAEIIDKTIQKYDTGIDVEKLYSRGLEKEYERKLEDTIEKLHKEIVAKAGPYLALTKIFDDKETAVKIDPYPQLIDIFLKSVRIHQNSDKHTILREAARRVQNACHPFTLAELLETSKDGKNELRVQKEYIETVRQKINNRVDYVVKHLAMRDAENSTQPGMGIATTGNRPSNSGGRDTYFERDTQLNILKEEYEFLISKLFREQINLNLRNCDDGWKSATVVKLRLIGTLYHLHRMSLSDTDASMTCNFLKQIANLKLSRLVLGTNDDQPFFDEIVPNGACERILGPLYGFRLSGSDSGCVTKAVSRVLYTEEEGGEDNTCGQLMEVAEILSKRLNDSNAEIGFTGLAIILKKYLEERPMETTLRSVKLGSFFVFSMDSCAIEDCQIRVRTLSESSAEAGISKSESTPSEIGRREALRLFLQLTCFASVRSYTVSPRAGERNTSFDAQRTNVSGVADYLGALGEVQLDRTAAGRSDQDHIFGIGDWGVGGRDDTIERNAVKMNEPCTPELMDVLAQYPVNVDFFHYVRKKIRAEVFNSALERPLSELVTTRLIRYVNFYWGEHLVGIKTGKRRVGPIEEWWTKYVVEECVRLRKTGTLNSTNCGAPDIQTLAAVAVSQRARNTSVGWIVSPRADGFNSYQKTLSEPLSALVSLPSWWAHLNLEVTTVWVRPRNLRRNLAPGSLCENARGSQVHKIELPLPGKAQEVLQKLGFFIIRTPYIDITQRNINEPVEAGRKARIRLVGGRLWKNPRVRLGSQWHDRIEVLPNMQGLIATFDCVEPSSNPGQQIAVGTKPQMSFDRPSGTWEISRDSMEIPVESQPETREVQVWTSEGVTLPQTVKVFAFRPRHMYVGELERPCWPMEPRRSEDNGPPPESTNLVPAGNAVRQVGVQ